MRSGEALEDVPGTVWAERPAASVEGVPPGAASRHIATAQKKKLQDIKFDTGSQ